MTTNPSAKDTQAAPAPVAAAAGTGPDGPDDAARGFSCPACGGPQAFSAPDRALRCRHCAHVGKALFSTAGKAADSQGDPRPAGHEFGTDGAAPVPDFAVVAPSQELNCSGCGGQVAFHDGVISSRCPYCARPVQAGDVSSGGAHPPVDGIVPFEVSPESARAKVETLIKETGS